MDLPWIGIFATEGLELTFLPDQVDDLALWTRSDVAEDVTYETGTSADLRRLDSIASRGSLGGTMAQTDSASKPVAASFPEGRAAFFDGSNDSQDSSLAASSWRFVQNGAGSTVITVFRCPNIASAARTLWATSNVNAAQVGAVFRTLTSGAVRLTLSDGVALDTFDSAGGVVSANTTHVVSVRHGSAETDVVNVRVDGTEVITAASYPTITPSASDPANPFKIGRRPGGADPFLGWIPETLVYDRYLSDSEVAAVEAYLAGKWTLDVDESAALTNASLWELEAFIDPEVGVSGTDWTDRTGNHTGTLESGVTIGAGATFSSNDVLSADADGERATFLTLGAALAGEDVPFSVLAVYAMPVDAAGRALWSLGNISSGTQHFKLGKFSDEDLYVVKRGNADAQTLLWNANPHGGTAHVTCVSHRGTTTSIYHDGSRVVDGAAQDHGAFTVDRFQLFRTIANFSENGRGEIAACLVFRRALNMGDAAIFEHMMRQSRGL